MAKVRQPISFTKDANHLPFYQDVAKALNGNISFGSPVDPTVNSSGVDSVNIQGKWVKVTSPVTPNTEFAVTHNLDYVPVGYDIKRQDKACSIYDGTTAWTRTQIFLKCSDR